MRPPKRADRIDANDQQRHWLCTAAMDLIRFWPLEKYAFEPLRCRLLTLGVPTVNQSELFYTDLEKPAAHS